VKDLHLAPTLTAPNTNSDYHFDSEHHLNYVAYTAPEHIENNSRKSTSQTHSETQNTLHTYIQQKGPALTPIASDEINQNHQNHKNNNAENNNNQQQKRTTLINPSSTSQEHNLSASESHQYTESTGYQSSARMNEPLASKLDFHELPSLNETFNQSRQSVAMIKHNSMDQRPRTSITGFSAYPLPGSDLSTKNGGIYESTKCSRNLLTEREILEFRVRQVGGTSDDTSTSNFRNPAGIDR
jgi:hypothetical protein